MESVAKCGSKRKERWRLGNKVLPKILGGVCSSLANMLEYGKVFQGLAVSGINGRWKQDKRFLWSDRSDELRRWRWVAYFRVV